MTTPFDDVRTALRQRAEADQILGAKAWPIAREVLRPPKKRTGRTSTAAASVPGRPADASARPPSSPAGPAPSAVGPASRRSRGTADVSDAEAAERRRTLDVLNDKYVKDCIKCALSKTRTKTVFGQGSAIARIAFVGEAPGADEDRTGLAFVGRAGQLLTTMIERGMGLSRDDVFICNVLKCRPPNNRTPATDEVAACSPYLSEQLSVIRPEVIIALGAPAAQTLLQTRESIGKLRGRFHDFYLPGGQLRGDPPIPLMPTYHPAYLLRNPPDKPKVWDDLKLVMARLKLPLPDGYV